MNGPMRRVADGRRPWWVATMAAIIMAAWIPAVGTIYNYGKLNNKVDGHMALDGHRELNRRVYNLEASHQVVKSQLSTIVVSQNNTENMVRQLVMGKIYSAPVYKGMRDPSAAPPINRTDGTAPGR